MTGKTSLKTNLSSMQVLKTLQILLQGNFTMNELIDKLNYNEPAPIFNNSVISKYINTCRYCGIDIHKIHNRYFVTNIPFGLDLSMNETDLLENLQKAAVASLSKKYCKIFDMFIEKLNKFSNKKIIRVDVNNSKASLELFEEAVAEKRIIKLMFKTRLIMECIPIKISCYKGKTFFHVFVKNRERMISDDRISGLEITNKKYIQSFNDQSVIYILRGNLVKKYALREHEQIINQDLPNSITISNKGEDKEVLFSRLLRYGKNCEIISPKSYREDMKNLLDDTLRNYGVL